jgi:hypothetical protein
MTRSGYYAGWLYSLLALIRKGNKSQWAVTTHKLSEALQSFTGNDPKITLAQSDS